MIDYDFVISYVAPPFRDMFEQFADNHDNPNYRDSFGSNILSTYLDFAETPCNLAVVQHILSCPGFELNLRDEYGRLQYFLSAPQTRIWEVLVSHGCNINLLDTNGQSLLHWHLEYDWESPPRLASIQKVKCLVRANFDLSNLTTDELQKVAPVCQEVFAEVHLLVLHVIKNVRNNQRCKLSSLSTSGPLREVLKYL
jgi:hypothetical protein